MVIGPPNLGVFNALFWEYHFTPVFLLMYPHPVRVKSGLALVNTCSKQNKTQNPEIRLII